MSYHSTLLAAICIMLRYARLDVWDVVHFLLQFCPDQGLELEWSAGQCCARFLATDPEESIEPLPKSTFRAILARFARLCNEREPGSVSPYGGTGELTFGGPRGRTFRVEFINTFSAQSVRLTPIRTVSPVDERLRPYDPDKDPGA